MVGPERWQIRCLKCDLARRALDAGIVRIGASNRKYTLAWCSRCRWFRFAVIEPTPVQGFEVVMRGTATDPPDAP